MSFRPLLARLYSVLPRLVLVILRPFLRAKAGAPARFLDRVSLPYAQAVYCMGEAHWESKVRSFGLSQCGVVLDVGSGPGQWLRLLARHNAFVVGLDVDSGLLEIARRNLGSLSKVALIEGQAEHMCFRDSVFDAILCYNVLMYTDFDSVVREMSRVLKARGRLVVGLTGFGYYLKHVTDGVRWRRIEAVRYGVEPIATHIGQRLLGQRTRSVNFWTGAGISRLLEKHGFEVVRVWADPNDPQWPASYFGAYFYFCVEASKKLRSVAPHSSNRRVQTEKATNNATIHRTS